MKKIIIGAAVALLGIVANAATTQWSAYDVYTYVGTGESTVMAEDYLVYYVDAATYSFEDAQKAVAKGDISFLTAEGTYAQVGEWDGAGYVYNETTGRYGDGVAVSAYAVILDSSTVAGAKHVYISDEPGTGTTGGKGQAATLEIDVTSSKSAANWQSVPEPTSGLLLLLGVAGLALKRKRA